MPCAILVKLDIANPQSRALVDKLGIQESPALVLMPAIAEKIEPFFVLEGYLEPYVVGDILNKNMLLAARLARSGTPLKFINNPQSVCQ